MDIDGGHIEWMALYELNVSQDEVVKLVKEWRAAEKFAEETSVEAFDLFPGFDQWIREHPTYNIKCVELEFNPMDAMTGEWLNEVSMP
jgi:hypothetical protein